MGKRYAIIDGKDVSPQEWHDYGEEQLLFANPNQDDIRYIENELSKMTTLGWKFQGDSLSYQVWVNVAEWEKLRRILESLSYNYSIVVPENDETAPHDWTSQFMNKGQVFMLYRDAYKNFRGTATAHKLGIL